MRDRREYSKQWRAQEDVPKRRAYHRQYKKNREKEFRELVLNKFSRKCSKCSFNDVRALQVDHINNDGSKERRLSCGQRVRFLRMVLEDTEGRYQLLCANCNLIKYFELTGAA